MRSAFLLVLVASLPTVVWGQGVDGAGIEYYVSPPVHDSLAAYIRARREADPALRFFLQWRVYAADERGLSVIEAPGLGCDSVHVGATARFLRLGDERLPVVSADDNVFGVSAWAPDPFGSSEQRPVRCGAIHEWPYTVRFHLSGRLISAGYEGIVRE